jgi:uncharacterized protein YaaR (DUF327 family)
MSAAAATTKSLDEHKSKLQQSMLQKRSQERERTLRTLLDKINNRCDVLK